MKRKIILLASIILLLNACNKEQKAKEQQQNQEIESLEKEIEELEKTLSLKKDSLEKYDDSIKNLKQQWDWTQELENKTSKWSNKSTRKPEATKKQSTPSTSTEIKDKSLLNQKNETSKIKQ